MAPGARGAVLTRPEDRVRWAPVLGLLAVLVEWLGFHWDIAWHGDVGRDRFLTPPHVMIIAGIVGVGYVAFVTLIGMGPGLRRRLAARPGVVLLGASALLTGVTLALDNWFHQQFGVDVAVWSPPHLMLGVAFQLALVGVIADHAGGRSPSRLATAGLAGVFLAVSSLALAEYDYGLPHQSLVWAPVVLALVIGIAFAMSRIASGLRWSASIAAAAAVGLRLAAIAFNAFVGRSLPTLPLGVLAGGLAFDLAWGRASDATRTRFMRALLMAWVATFAVQAAWLRVAGKTWWVAGVMRPGLVLGAGAVLFGGLVGRGLGRRFALASGRAHLVRARSRAWWVAPAAAATVFSVLFAASGWGRLGDTSRPLVASYTFVGDHVRLVIPGAQPTDWVSVAGPRDLLGIFGPPPRTGRYHVLRFGTPIAEIQGPRLRTARWYPLHIPVPWLGGLTWKHGGFEGRVAGRGEFVGFWYVGASHSFGGIAERTRAGHAVLARHFVPPAHAPRAWAAPVGMAAVGVLVLICFALAVGLLDRAVMLRTRRDEVESPVDFRPPSRPREVIAPVPTGTRRQRPLVATRQR